MSTNNYESSRQKKIFGENLLRLVNSKYPMQQKDIAKELGEHATTFNTWCMGKAMPGMGKVQKIADYFGVGKSALLDELDLSEAELDAEMTMDKEFKELYKKYKELTEEQKTAIKVMIDSLYSH